MNGHIWAFIAFGIAFGVLTYTNRHLFGEGPSKRDESDPYDGPRGRVLWVTISSLLWPILVFTGAYGFWRHAQARRLERVNVQRASDARD